MKFVIFALIPLILSIGISPAISFGETIDSPRKQMQNGIDAKDVVCKSGFTLMIRNSGNAVCMMPTTAEKLENRAWGVIEKEFSSDSVVETMLTTEETQRITEEAFIYAYPMLENYKTMYNAAIDESSELYVAPFNQLYHNEGLSTPQDTWVTTPNSDTIYTRGWLDLSTEPVIIIIPEIEQDRYYTFQLIDYYSNNFGYMGTRTTGNDGGIFLIAGPNWNGTIPDEITETHQAETDYVMIFARTQVKNQDDVSNALEIMKKYELKTFSEYLGTPTPESTTKASFIPWNAEKAYGSEFVNYLNLILTWTEIHSSEKQMFEDFSKIGINAGKNIEFDESKKIIIDEATSSAMQKIKEGIFVLGTFENGWIVLDAFGDREFHETNYLKRSVAALYGLYGNTMEEALYPAGLVDAEKNILDGSKSNYQIKFSEEPPVDAFWSVTMYDQENRLLVENPINRYLINSISEINKNEDGSFVIYVQHEPPSEDKLSNWLPAPDGPIYMILRLYIPSDSIIDGTWELPIIAIESSSDSVVDTMLTAEESQSIAEEAYIFGYPLVLVNITLERMSNAPQAGDLYAPLNQFAHLPEFPDVDFKEVVRVNHDTLYSSAVLDLSQEPIILHVPDTQGRYYLLPMLDAWSNVFASPGKRTTGTEANDFAITGPFWDGTLPEGVTKLESPTEMVWIIGRTQTNGAEDYDFVHSIQQGYTLTPLSSFGIPYTPPQNVPTDSTIDMVTAPVEQVDLLDVNTFFNTMAMVMKTNPPAPEDADMIVKFEKIGLIPGQEFDSSNLDPEVISAIESGAISGRQKIESDMTNLVTIENGWTKMLNTGSYGTDYLLRATIALWGLGANVPEDAIYPATFNDSDGNALNGANNYMIHFPEGQTPPVNAFWSLTMYGEDSFTVENPIDRYTIGDRSELVYNDDGSLDIYIQHESPDGNESNWLPAPDDNFNLLMRLYWPSQDVLDGTWKLPMIEKISNN